MPSGCRRCRRPPWSACCCRPSSIMLPIVTGQSEPAGGVLSGAFALNGVLAVAGLYLAFALFPARRAGRPAAAAGAGRPAGANAQRRGRNAGDAAGLHAALRLRAELGDAGALHHRHRAGLAQPPRRARDRRGERALGGPGGGAGAGLQRALHVLAPARRRAAGHGLPRPPGGPLRFRGPHRGAVALAIPLVWLLLGTAEGARSRGRSSGASIRSPASSTRSGRAR